MNFNERITIIVETTVSDGCGGYITEEVVYGESCGDRRIKSVSPADTR